MELARGNIEHYELEDQIKVVETDLIDMFLKKAENSDSGEEEEKKENQEEGKESYFSYFDTILMNPPFGTKKNEGIDMKLL